MAKRTLAGLLVVTLALMAFGKGKLEWVDNYEDGLKKAKEQGKPAMLYFTADW